MVKSCFLVAIVLCWCIIAITAQFTDCNSVTECASDTITTTNIVKCFGYLSCLNASITSSSHISCDASYSCYNARLINYNGTANDGLIECVGLYSCMGADSITTSADINCHGESSCSNTNIIIDSNGSSEINCQGSRSFASTTVTINGSGTQFKMESSLSGSNSVFKVEDDVIDVYFEFYGGYSGYNATIIGGNSSVVNITCWGNGCNELTARCINNDTNDTNCQINVDCTSAEQSDLCPDGTYV